MLAQRKLELGGISGHSPFVTMQSLDWSCVEERAELRFYRRSTIISQQQYAAESAFLVKSGRVRIDILAHNGETRSLLFAAAGSLLGELPILDGLPNTGTAIATVDSELYVIPKGMFYDLLAENAQFADNVLKVLAEKTRVLITQVENLSFYNSYYKVGYVMRHLIKRYGVKTEKGYKMSIKFTHQEMAALTGLSRVSVSKILSDMVSEGIIQKKDGQLIVNSMDDLNDFIISRSPQK